MTYTRMALGGVAGSLWHTNILASILMMITVFVWMWEEDKMNNKEPK